MIPPQRLLDLFHRVEANLGSPQPLRLLPFMKRGGNSLVKFRDGPDRARKIACALD
jgi:hypothetical protein